MEVLLAALGTIGIVVVIVWAMIWLMMYSDAYDTGRRDGYNAFRENDHYDGWQRKAYESGWKAGVQAKIDADALAAKAKARRSANRF